MQYFSAFDRSALIAASAYSVFAKASFDQNTQYSAPTLQLAKYPARQQVVDIRSAVSAEHLPIAGHFALVNLPAMPSSMWFSTGVCRAFMGYLRCSQQDAWQHETITLRKAGRQLQRKVAAVQQALMDRPQLAQRLGLGTGASGTTMCGWFVDTSIDCDHQRFGGFLKVSLEELLIALSDDRHFLHDPDGLLVPRVPAATVELKSRYPQRFSAQRFIEVVEAQAVWDGV